LQLTFIQNNPNAIAVHIHTETTRMQLRGCPLTLLLLLMYQSLAGPSWLLTLGCSGNLEFARSTLKIASGRSVSQQTPPSLPGYPFVELLVKLRFYI